MSTTLSRRSILAGGLAGAGAAAAAPMLLSQPARAAAPATPASGSGRVFTLAVIPDTQYLFDGESLHPEPLTETMKHLATIKDLAFVAHLGEVVQNGLAQEIAAAKKPFDTLAKKKIPFSVVAGNHDLPNSNTDDQRGPTPFLDTFAQLTSRQRIARDAGGYNSAYTFDGAGTRFLLLALDWRLSAAGIVWARSVLEANAQLPTIITVHDAISADSGTGVLSSHGKLVWDNLIKDHKQVFLSINGHFWPSGRLIQNNVSGQPVELHLANYQQLYYGGAAAVRLYRFDLDRGVVDVSTEVPHIGAGGLNELESEELQLTAETDRFSFALPPALKPHVQREPRPASALVIPGTEAYWRFEGSGSLATGRQIDDASGRGNTLVVAGPSTVPLAFAKDCHPAQPAGSSLEFSGTKDTGAYLLTVDTAPINKAAFESGYTFEAFFKFPEPFTGDSAWSAIISRWISAKAAGRVNGEVEEPAATLSISGGPELQWCVYPTNLDRSVTNWGHELRTSRWWHVAVVNDGRLTTMYVDGCAVVRNPSTVNRGLAGSQSGAPWAVGAYSWAGQLDKTWIGTIGDIRIVSRALAPREFMIG
ncbi:LamG-like jellyroll fold domain-containing protein [Arthrobacter glacialis]|uniref:Tat pathway signal sequence domain protein n=1 Tax=Arthrobacter glacialis TaxID=1664 RepID=A0A2S3ZVY2_ARTGL|nr:LamG-like jellyroll fold domain-containing protein [Arthrobacter glacialis]POH73249.1 Tat pathway signal sequence domain protein [Arthrobacter glacialis]